MPELPEVETVRRQLEPEVVGRRVEGVSVLDARWSAPDPPGQIERGVKGRRIEAVERRGKWLLLRLDGGKTLLMHLRMTGNLLLRPPGAESSDGEPLVDLMDAMRYGSPRLHEDHPQARYLRAAIRLEDGSELWFTDLRRFGTGKLIENSELGDYLSARAGVEPLSEKFTAEALCALAAGRTVPLKSFLLIQSAVAGVGNIYADEALHRAALHPLSPAGSMRPEHCEALRAGVVAALEVGLASGGASMSDYRDARGGRGRMQDEFLVHRREGKPCPRCGEAIRRIVVGGRSTYFCPACQVRLRRRPRGRATRAKPSAP